MGQSVLVEKRFSCCFLKNCNDIGCGRVGEAKRRKQILGDTYGRSGTFGLQTKDFLAQYWH